jgi:hypothetical protein
MARYSTIRGWIQLYGEVLPQIEEIILEFRGIYQDYDLSKDAGEAYQQGWTLQRKPYNIPLFIFYGAIVRSSSRAFIKDQVKKIATTVYSEDPPYKDYVRGMFVINDEDEDFARLWQFEDGVFKESRKKNLFTK